MFFPFTSYHRFEGFWQRVVAFPLGNKGRERGAQIPFFFFFSLSLSFSKKERRMILKIMLLSMI